MISDGHADADAVTVVIADPIEVDDADAVTVVATVVVTVIVGPGGGEPDGGGAGGPDWAADAAASVERLVILPPLMAKVLASNWQSVLSRPQIYDESEQDEMAILELGDSGRRR